jgi:hypothetical protein
MSRCHRCRRETVDTILSMFNRDELCLECKLCEEQHPRYDEARAAEEAAVRRGELDFPGIGRPREL